jgi:hypothetical protein
LVDQRSEPLGHAGLRRARSIASFSLVSQVSICSQRAEPCDPRPGKGCSVAPRASYRFNDNVTFRERLRSRVLGAESTRGLANIVALDQSVAVSNTPTDWPIRELGCDKPDPHTHSRPKSPVLRPMPVLGGR